MVIVRSEATKSQKGSRTTEQSPKILGLLRPDRNRLCENSGVVLAVMKDKQERE
jgi:hypothetical protein